MVQKFDLPLRCLWDAFWFNNKHVPIDIGRDSMWIICNRKTMEKVNLYLLNEWEKKCRTNVRNEQNFVFLPENFMLTKVYNSMLRVMYGRRLPNKYSQHPYSPFCSQKLLHSIFVFVENYSCVWANYFRHFDSKKRIFRL